MKAVLQPASGRILVSEPSLTDRFFARSVVLLAEHDTEGSFGLIINKPSEIKLSQITDEFPDFDPFIYLGGPVKVENLYFIHTKGDEIEGSLRILDGLFWGGDVKQIKEMIRTKAITDKDIRFFIGYAGWQPRQLEKELSENAWLVLNTSVEEVFKVNTEHTWRKILISMGDDYAPWVNYPEDPQMN
ncbi:MAG: YqgE/AlgH family protein [Bacteroidales bacterium]|nr:YqgE/AlgH family protein [Bacteroidales bacterium]